MHTLLLLIASSLLGILVLQRLVGETRKGLLLALGPLQGLALLELTANFTSSAHWNSLIYLCAALAALLAFLPSPGLHSAELSRRWKLIVGLTLLVVLGYTQYAQMRFLDTDNWVHEPLIAFYMRGLWPPIHPYFPDIQLNGHFGRDLLMAVLTPPLADPLGTVWLVNLLAQACAFMGLFALALRYGERPLSAYLCALLIFFGICVGSRVGMADTFDGNNGIVYAFLVLLLYHLAQVLEIDASTSRPATRWISAGVTLGAYQAVYESNFGVLFLVGLTLALCLRKPARVWGALLVVAAIALLLACNEGGPLTDLAHRQRGAALTTQTEQNQGQHVALHFPKEKFLQVLVTTAEYQRVSAAFQSKLFASCKPRLAGEGYMGIYDPRFLYAHWLPLYLAPLSLWTLLRKRSQLGLIFWSFGCWAYLIPAIIDFGPLYELEYFRWEYAAGWGFAGALGLALGQWFPQAPLSCHTSSEGLQLHFRRSFPRFAGALLVLIGSLAAGEKLLNDALLHPVKMLQSINSWRENQPDLGLCRADLEAMNWMAPQVSQGQRVLSNLGSETALGIWPDSVLATRTGAVAAGHDHPPEGSRQHAHPSYYRNALARAFQATGRPDLLQAAHIHWLFVDPAQLSPAARETLQRRQPDLKVFSSGDQTRWVASLPPATPPPPVASGQAEIHIAPLENPDELRAGRRYPVQLTLRNPQPDKIHLGWIRSQVPGQEPLDLCLNQDLEPGASLQLEHSLVTPLAEGAYTCQFSQDTSPLAEGAFHTDIKKRLARLHARLDLPDSFEKKRFYSLRLGLTSAQTIHAGSEFTLSWRLRVPGGDYLWNLDSIPQAIVLDLEAGQEREYSLQFLSPQDSGLYQPELELREKSSGAIIPLQGQLGPVRVP